MDLLQKVISYLRKELLVVQINLEVLFGMNMERTHLDFILITRSILLLVVTEI